MLAALAVKETIGQEVNVGLVACNGPAAVLHHRAKSARQIIARSTTRSDEQEHYP